MDHCKKCSALILCPDCLAVDSEKDVDRVLWLTCEECGGTGSTEKAHPFPDDPEFCEVHRCEACGGSGRICR